MRAVLHCELSVCNKAAFEKVLRYYPREATKIQDQVKKKLAFYKKKRDDIKVALQRRIMASKMDKQSVEGTLRGAGQLGGVVDEEDKIKLPMEDRFVLASKSMDTLDKYFFSLILISLIQHSTHVFCCRSLRDIVSQLSKIRRQLEMKGLQLHEG